MTGHRPRVKGYAIKDARRRISMLPPQCEPAYRKRHENRKRLWLLADRERLREEWTREVQAVFGRVKKKQAATKSRWWPL